MTDRVDHHRPQFPDLIGQFKHSYHLELISDRIRTAAMFHALDQSLDESSVFCELGCGTGIFSIYAAQRCKRVIAVEIDPKIAAVARNNIQQLNLQDRIVVHHTAARTSRSFVRISRISDPIPHEIQRQDRHTGDDHPSNRPFPSVRHITHH